MTLDGPGERTTPFGGGSDVDGERAIFAIVSSNCGATTFNGTGFNIWASIAYYLIMVGMELRMLCMLSLVILKKLVCELTI